MALGLIWAKVVSLTVMFFVTMCFGVFSERLVWCLKKRGKDANIDTSLVVHLMNCFAGGLFLGTFLLGLLPEVRDLFEAVLIRYQVDTHFPVAEAVTAVGFFMVMFVEHLVEICQSRGKDKDCHKSEKNAHAHHWHVHDHKNWHAHHHSHDLRSHDGLSVRPLETFHYVNENGERVSGFPPETRTEFNSRKDESSQSTRFGIKNVAFDGECGPVVSSSGNGVELSSGPNTTNLPRKCLEQAPPYSGDVLPEKDVLSDERAEEAKGLSLRSILLVLALSMHTLFEGLALGLLDVEAAVWTLMIAVTVHKSVIMIALGIQLCKVKTNTIKMIYFNIFLFAIMSPIGIGVGTAVTETGNPDDLITDTASSILQALATGTFLYVTFFEVLNRELESSPDLRKVLAVMVGFSGSIGLKFLEHQGH